MGWNGYGVGFLFCLVCIRGGWYGCFFLCERSEVVEDEDEDE